VSRCFADVANTLIVGQPVALFSSFPFLITNVDRVINAFGLEAEAVEASVSLLLAQEAAEGSVPASLAGSAALVIFKSAAVLLVDLIGGILRIIWSWVLSIFVGIVDFLSGDVKLSQLVHVIDHLVADLDTLPSLL